MISVSHLFNAHLSEIILIISPSYVHLDVRCYKVTAYFYDNRVKLTYALNFVSSKSYKLCFELNVNIL